jgi:hypothetical protein
MNKLLQITFCLLLPFVVKAQVNGNYSFSKLTGTYTDLPAGKTVMQTAWSNPFNNLAISTPLDFEAFSTPTDATQFLVDSRGIVTCNPAFIPGTFYISALGSSLYGVAASQAAEVSYIKEGTYPNEILKVQFKGAGFVLESGHSSYINFQIWLYENGDIIEMRYGPNSITSTQADAEGIGIFYDDGFNTTASIELFGNSANPTTGTGSLTDGQHISNIPTSGAIYRFTPTSLGVAKQAALEKVSAVYDPERKEIFLNAPTSSTPLNCELYNIAGQRLLSGTINEKTSGIAVNDIPTGLYIIKITGKQGTHICKVLL